jgi:preprotein translocase subunit SecB
MKKKSSGFLHSGLKELSLPPINVYIVFTKLLQEAAASPEQKQTNALRLQYQLGS